LPLQIAQCYNPNVSYSVTVEGFDSLTPAWSKLVIDCPACPVFFTPQWQETWWRHFGNGEPLLLAVRHEGVLAGVAPLMKTERGISLLGSGNVCDYLDIVARPGHEEAVCRASFDFVQQMPWDKLDLFSLPSEAVARKHFLPLARHAGMSVREEIEDVCPQRELPSSWEEYVSLLGRDARHEFKRKMRRLSSVPGVTQEVVTSPANLEHDMSDFLRLFLDSREAKVDFLTPGMEVFFRDLARVTAENGWLKLFFLTVSGARIASAIILDIGDTFYLYNSGYDKRFSNLSAGLLLKAQCIEAAIAAGKKRFDFLRGREPYKYDLGGIDQPVYRCEVSRG